MSFQKKRLNLNLRGGGRDRERRQGESERDWERDHSHLKQGQTPLFLESSQSRKTEKFLHTRTQTHPHKLALTHLHTHNAPSTSHAQLGSHFTWTRCTAHAPNPVPKGDRASQWQALRAQKELQWGRDSRNDSWSQGAAAAILYQCSCVCKYCISARFPRSLN